MEYRDIKHKQKLFLHINNVRNKLDVSAATIRGLCANENLNCLKIGGAWYIENESLTRGLQTLQKNRTKKSLILSKIRNSDSKRLIGQFKATNWLSNFKLKKKKKGKQ